MSIKETTLLHEIVATRVFPDFEVRVFLRHLISAILRKFCILNHFNFAFLINTQFILVMLLNISLTITSHLNFICIPAVQIIFSMPVYLTMSTFVAALNASWHNGHEQVSECIP